MTLKEKIEKHRVLKAELELVVTKIKENLPSAVPFVKNGEIHFMVDIAKEDE